MQPEKFQELLARVKAKAQAAKDIELAQKTAFMQEAVKEKNTSSIEVSNLGNTSEEVEDAVTEILSGPEVIKKHLGVAKKVELNLAQNTFITTALNGEDIVLIGSAGTGKTTCTGVALKELLHNSTHPIPKISTPTKYLTAGVPGIAVISYTRKAVNNIRRAVMANTPEISAHVITMHKLLEFGPIWYEVVDSNTKEVRNTMRFEPARNRINPLPSSLRLVVFEESSMIGLDLYNLYKDATPHRPQEIFIGDIRQLPPVFGPAILGFKMALLPVVELTEVHRQGLKSPILRLAQSILTGNSHLFSPNISTEEIFHPILQKKIFKKFVPSLQAFEEDSEEGLLKFQIWQGNMAPDKALNTALMQFNHWSDTGYYDKDRDLILCPFNKAFGTIELNKGLHQFFGKKRDATVYEIIAGFNKHYLAEGDRVLYDKEDAVIIRIEKNPTYLGPSPLPASKTLNRWGFYEKDPTREEIARSDKDAELTDEVLDKFLLTGNTEDEEGRVNSASHIVTIRFSYSDEVLELQSSSEINALLGGHAITVHKAQGSEEEKVFIILHRSHAVMNQQELLYTAVTRARKKLHIICEADTFYKGVKSQMVKGVTLEEKIETFKGKGDFLKMQQEMEQQRRDKEQKFKALQATRAQYTTAISRLKEKAYEHPDLHLFRMADDFDPNPYYERTKTSDKGNEERCTRVLAPGPRIIPDFKTLVALERKAKIARILAEMKDGKK